MQISHVSLSSLDSLFLNLLVFSWPCSSGHHGGLLVMLDLLFTRVLGATIVPLMQPAEVLEAMSAA